MKWLSLPVILKLCRQDRFDVLRVRGEDDSLVAADGGLDGVGRGSSAVVFEHPFPEFEILVGHGGADGTVYEVDACGSRDALAVDQLYRYWGERLKARHTEWEVCT